MDFAKFLTKLKENGGYEAWARAFGAVPAGQLSAQCDDRLKYFFAELRRAPSPSLPQGAGGFFSSLRPQIEFESREKYRDASAIVFAEAVRSLQGGGQWFADYLKSGDIGNLTVQQQAFVKGWDRLIKGMMNHKVTVGGQRNTELNFVDLLELVKSGTVSGTDYLALLNRHNFAEQELKDMGPELATQWLALSGSMIQGAVDTARAGGKATYFNKLLGSISYSGGVSQSVISTLNQEILGKTQAMVPKNMTDHF